MLDTGKLGDVQHVARAMGINLLAFFLTLSIWNTWRAVTYVLSPIPDMIGLRCTLNLGLCLMAIMVVVASNKWFQHVLVMRNVVVLGTVIAGIACWELIESLVTYSTGLDISIELIIYFVSLVVCSLLLIAIYVWKGVSIIDSSLLSPV